MKVNAQTLEKNMAKITVEIDAAEFQKCTVDAYNRKKSNFNIPGFRKGKASKAVIEKMYGPAVFFEDAADICINKTYYEAVKESGLDVVSRPDINIEKIAPNEPFIYSVSVAVKPEVKLGEYKGLKVEKADTTVSAKEVDAELKRIQEQNSRIVAVEDESRTVKKDDIVTIDFEGFVDGKPFAGGQGTEYPITIGSHSFIDNFEDQLIGHKKGDNVDVNVTFPENYQAEELKGKPALFKVSIKEIKVKELPELDDDFASEVSEFETLKEYKAQLKKDLKSRREKSAAQINENNVVKAAVENAEIDIPEPMIETTVDNMIEDYTQRLKSQGIPMDQYFKITGLTMESLREEYKPQAIESIRTRLVLETVAKAENIEVTPERLDEELGKIAEAYKMDIEKVREFMSDDSLATVREDIKCQEAIDLLVAEAVLTSPEKKSKKSAEKAEEE